MPTTKEKGDSVTPNLGIEKKLIQWGGFPLSQEFVKEHITEMENVAPFDGIVIGARIQNKISGDQPFGQSIFALEYDADEVSPIIKVLREASFSSPQRKFKYNFLSIGTNNGALDWFDDEKWNTIATNFLLAARIAKKGGLKGLLFDPEFYYNPGQNDLFNYWFYFRKYGGLKLFQEYKNKARYRGRQLMRGINREYPDITLFFTFAYSQLRESLKMKSGNDFDDAWKKDKYSLLPPFVDGILLESTQANIIDGVDATAPVKTEDDFKTWYDRAKTMRANLCFAKESCNKVHVGFKTEMEYGADNYAAWSNLSTKDYTDWPKSGLPFQPKDLAQALYNSLKTTDEYSWLYTPISNWWGEKYGGSLNIVSVSEKHREAVKAAKVAVKGVSTSVVLP